MIDFICKDCPKGCSACSYNYDNKAIECSSCENNYSLNLVSLICIPYNTEVLSCGSNQIVVLDPKLGYVC